ncbi:hypothetical protein [Rhizobium leguminosarum]|nr:hypothetical protein [Rhizobium leguminosarum]
MKTHLAGIAMTPLWTRSQMRRLSYGRSCAAESQAVDRVDDTLL